MSESDQKGIEEIYKQQISKCGSKLQHMLSILTEDYEASVIGFLLIDASIKIAKVIECDKKNFHAQIDKMWDEASGFQFSVDKKRSGLENDLDKC